MFGLKDTEQAYIKAAIWGLMIGLITEACNFGLPGLSSLAGSYIFEKLTKWSNING